MSNDVRPDAFLRQTRAGHPCTLLRLVEEIGHTLPRETRPVRVRKGVVWRRFAQLAEPLLQDAGGTVPERDGSFLASLAQELHDRGRAARQQRPLEASREHTGRFSVSSDATVIDRA